jgi:hypothetical protein
MNLTDDDVRAAGREAALDEGQIARLLTALRQQSQTTGAPARFDLALGIIALGIFLHRQQPAIAAWLVVKLPSSIRRLRPAHAVRTSQQGEVA